MMKNNLVKSILNCLIILFLFIYAKGENRSALLTKIKNGIDSGRIAYKLTEPEEIKTLLGAPQKENEIKKRRNADA